MTRVMVTGHRPQHLSGDQMMFAQGELERLAIRLREERGMTVGISGMALGADTWWAATTLWAKMELWSFLPFPQQADRWGPADRELWEGLRARASWEHVTADRYSVGALHRRNDDMLDNADVVIAVWCPSKTTGGTASCVEKANRRGMPLITVNLDEMKTTARWRNAE